MAELTNTYYTRFFECNFSTIGDINSDIETVEEYTHDMSDNGILEYVALNGEKVQTVNLATGYSAGTFTTLETQIIEDGSIVLCTVAGVYPAGMTYNNYYVVNGTGTSLQLSLTENGDPIIFSDAGSGTLTITNYDLAIGGNYSTTVQDPCVPLFPGAPYNENLVPPRNMWIKALRFSENFFNEFANEGWLYGLNLPNLRTPPNFSDAESQKSYWSVNNRVWRNLAADYDDLINYGFTEKEWSDRGWAVDTTANFAANVRTFINKQLETWNAENIGSYGVGDTEINLFIFRVKFADDENYFLFPLFYTGNDPSYDSKDIVTTGGEM